MQRALVAIWASGLTVRRIKSLDRHAPSTTHAWKPALPPQREGEADDAHNAPSALPVASLQTRGITGRGEGCGSMTGQCVNRRKGQRIWDGTEAKAVNSQEFGTDQRMGDGGAWRGTIRQYGPDGRV
eukprot:349679-Chlamydomonas_euryale.AAC.13